MCRDDTMFLNITQTDCFDWVQKVAFSNCGKFLVCGCDNGKIYIHDLETNNNYATLMEDAEDKIYAVAVSPVGNKIASGSKNGIVRIWNLNTPYPSSIVYNHKNLCDGVVFSPDGNELASFSWNNEIVVQHIALKTCIVFKSHTSQIKDANFLNNDQMITLCNRQCIVWEKSSKTHLLCINADNTEYLTSVAVSAKSDKFAITSWIAGYEKSSGSIRMYDLDGYSNTKTVTKNMIKHGRFSINNNLFAFSQLPSRRNNEAKLLNDQVCVCLTNTYDIVVRQFHQQFLDEIILDMQICPNGRRLAVSTTKQVYIHFLFNCVSLAKYSCCLMLKRTAQLVILDIVNFLLANRYNSSFKNESLYLHFDKAKFLTHINCDT